MQKKSPASGESGFAVDAFWRGIVTSIFPLMVLQGVQGPETIDQDIVPGIAPT